MKEKGIVFAEILTFFLLDCLLRNVGKVRWLLFIDFDEFVVPKSFPPPVFKQQTNQLALPTTQPNLQQSLPEWLESYIQRQFFSGTLPPQNISKHSHNNNHAPQYPKLIPVVSFYNQFFCVGGHGTCNQLNNFAPPNGSLSSLSGLRYGCPLPPKFVKSDEDKKKKELIKYFPPLRLLNHTQGGRFKFVVDPMFAYLFSIHSVSLSLHDLYGPREKECVVKSNIVTSLKSLDGLPIDRLVVSGTWRAWDAQHPKDDLSLNVTQWAFSIFSDLHAQAREKGQIHSKVDERRELRSHLQEQDWWVLLKALNSFLAIKGKEDKKVTLSRMTKTRNLRPSEEEALLHHYREGVSEMRLDCNTLDYSFLDTYGELLFQKVEDMF